MFIGLKLIYFYNNLSDLIIDQFGNYQFYYKSILTLNQIQYNNSLFKFDWIVSFGLSLDFDL